MKKLLLILLLVLAGEISAQQAATIVVKTTPDNEIVHWPTGKEHLFCIALGTKSRPSGRICPSIPHRPPRHGAGMDPRE